MTDLIARYRRGGTEGWGKVASAYEHVRYSERVEPRSRRRCGCGCKRRATHKGMANGVCLKMGCELSIARWVRNPIAALKAKGGEG